MELETARALAETKQRSLESHALEREAALEKSFEARLEAVEKEKASLRESHHATLGQMREAEEVRRQQHDVKLDTARKAHAALERRCYEREAHAESLERELARVQSELAEAGHAEGALKEALERQREAAAEQSAAAAVTFPAAPAARGCPFRMPRG
jgi:predicted  nucleic acid-binding Zn-ribbon protein